jgi:hypothetical protein
MAAGAAMAPTSLLRPCAKSCPSSVPVLAAGAARAEMFQQHHSGVGGGGLLGCLPEMSWWRGWQKQSGDVRHGAVVAWLAALALSCISDLLLLGLVRSR